MSDVVLKTKRLRLEIIDKEYLDDLYALLSNPRVQLHFPKVLNRREANEFYERIQTRYRSDGYCFWAVIRKEDHEFLGICGVLRQEIDGQVEAEIAYRLMDTFWGKGYGTEAAEGCIKYAKEKL